MDKKRRKFISGALAALAAPALSRMAFGQSYPSRTVRLVVGFPAGGPVDIAGRLIATCFTKQLGQEFVVENLAGESGNTATRSVVKAEPDGYTLLVCGPVNTINTTLFPTLDFDFSRDIIPVASLYRVPLVLEVHPSVPVRTLAELIAYARSHPGKLRVGYAGRGTPQHIGIELFKAMAGVDWTLVPYLGSTPALADLLTGNVDIMFDPMPSSIAHIRNGELIPLAVTTLTRSESLPGVPVAADAVPGYQAGSWFGVGAPKGVSMAVVDVLNAAANAALAIPTTKEMLAEMGAIAMPGSPGEFQAFVAEETKKYATVIRSAGIPKTR